MKKKPSRRRKATPPEAQAALARWYSDTQVQWQAELVSQNPDWMRLFQLHNHLLEIEIQVPKITEY